MIQQGPSRPGSAEGGVTLVLNLRRKAPLTNSKDKIQQPKIHLVFFLAGDVHVAETSREAQRQTSPPTHNSPKERVQANTDPGVEGQFHGTKVC
ncbi:hypothetical protein BpHYR1_046472 [Brachionus plicatilis]|uniref:Uncharacterized protein n=1 Tax=Brachionus plicatilis TaxID=10195 RepID=A0A3M7PM51_BRAPC|nr:hypothetical protein BpHYR1_046472 [Brachionus plicatilis]